MTVILASTAITIVMTSLQLWFDYRVSLESMHKALTQVRLSYASSLTASLWTYDHALVESQLEGITNLTEIEWAEIISEDGARWASGERRSTYTLEDVIPLVYGTGARAKKLGQLTLLSSIDQIYWALARKFTVILGLNLIKTLCMSAVIIFLFHQIVGRHLMDLAGYLPSLSLTERSPRFQLRDHQKRSNSDELDLLVDAINVMRDNLQSSYDEVAKYRDGLEIALQKERELTGLQRQFVSMVSHEFRTPLAVIDGSAQRLLRRKEQVSAERMTGALVKIRTSVRRLTELMESVLSAARLEDCRIQIEPVDCDIAALVTEICAGYRELDTGHKIIEEIGRRPNMIQADEKLLRQAFSNLVSNAVKYAPSDTTIRVTAHDDGRDHVLISVRDEGVGIPEDELDRLFGRFFRASTSTGIPGSGIGLHLVKHLIDMHGGTIDVTSRPGQGSTFSVRLPRHCSSGRGEGHDPSTIDDVGDAVDLGAVEAA
ncbi:MAG: ATP-binding protein [Alphaproteobacteria bacterium]